MFLICTNSLDTYDVRYKQLLAVNKIKFKTIARVFENRISFDGVRITKNLRKSS